MKVESTLKKEKVKALLFYLVLLVISLGLTVGTVFYQRPSSEVVRYGNLCNIEEWMHCYQPREAAGFPFPYVFDVPGVSVEHIVSLAMEDEFRLLPFLIDIWFYFLLLIVTLSYFTKK